MSRLGRAVVLASIAACTNTGSTSIAGSGSNVVSVDTSGAAIESIAISPLTLVPAFSASIYDYYVTCSAGTNSLDVTIDDADGETSGTYSVAANQALVAGDYWIRCLPPDFPAISVTTSSAGAPTDGYYLVNSVPYVVVLDIRGTPVWYKATAEGCNLDSPATNTLSFMPHAEYPFGYDSIPSFEIDALDTGVVTTIVAPDAPTNEHELRVLDNGDVLLFADQHTAGVDLTGIGLGSDQIIDDCKIEELDPSGAIVWSWLGSEHIDPNQETVYPYTYVLDNVTVQDVFHCNAIDVGSNGDLLVSSRHTSAVFDIDKASGTVQWKLGGTTYNKDGAPVLSVIDDDELGFSLQHDARFTATGDITLFDDHTVGAGLARGLELSLDHTANTAQIVWQAKGDEASEYMGSFRRYDDGDSVIGWGYLPNEWRVVSELDADGNDVLDISFNLDVVFNALTYRAIKVPLSQLDHDLLRATAGQ
jgi:Arylsulfotransferase (ASST)